MNTFPLYKILTLVGLVFFTSMGWGEDKPAAAPGTGTSQSAAASLGAALLGNNNGVNCQELAKQIDDGTLKSDSSQYKLYQKKCLEGNSECKDDTRALNEKYTKMNEACNGFTQKKDGEGKSVSCAQKLKNCQAQMDGAFSMNGGSDGLSILESLANAQIAKSVSGNVDVTSLLGNQSKSCIKEFDPKEVRKAEENLKKEKKDLEEKIKKEYEKQAKYREEQREKQDKITKQTAEIEKNSVTETQNENKTVREQLAAAQKSSIDNSASLRKMTLSITKSQQELANENQAYQIALLDLTDEKVTQKCKQEFESLKAAIVNSKADPNGTPEQKQLFALASTFKANGIQGSGDLRNLLMLTKKNCFEKASTQKNQNALKHSQAIQNINNAIDETKKSLDDAKARIAADNDNLAKIQQESKDKLSAAEKAKLTELQNLNTEMTNFITSIEEKNKISTTEVAKLTADIKNLVLKTDFNAEPAFTDAENAIDSYQNARTDVMNSCGCPEKPTGGTAKANRDAMKAALKTAAPICKRVMGDGFGDPTKDPENPNGPTDFSQ